MPDEPLKGAAEVNNSITGRSQDPICASSEILPPESNKQQIGVTETARPGSGGEPTRVSLYIDGEDRKITVRTSDLENIGNQLRGRRRFSFFNTVLPIIITLITVIGTTIIAQLFQYISWRNSTALQTTTQQVQDAQTTLQTASAAMDKRYYETKVFLAAAHDLALEKNDDGDAIRKLATTLNQYRFNEFYNQLQSWHEHYDDILNAIDHDLDQPVNLHERVSARYFEGKQGPIFNCTQLLTSEFKRLKLTINSLKIQFAAINYCFGQSIKGFNDGQYDAIVSNSNLISATTQKGVSDLNDDIYSMSNEFRCFAQHRIDFLEIRRRNSIFRLPNWLYNNSFGFVKSLFVKPDNVITQHFNATLAACTFG